jgi:hypothetical protein
MIISASLPPISFIRETVNNPSTPPLTTTTTTTTTTATTATTATTTVTSSRVEDEIIVVR